MDPTSAHSSTRSPDRVLAVADWSVDPRVVAEDLRARSLIGPTVFSLLVPSRLPGLDWVGDPHASRPCAAQQLEELERLCRASDISVARASVGDPERLPAIRAALELWPARGVLLFERKRPAFIHPLRLPNRVKRSLRLPVETFAVRSRLTLVRGNGRAARRAPRCAVPTVLQPNP